MAIDASEISLYNLLCQISKLLGTPLFMHRIVRIIVSAVGNVKHDIRICFFVSVPIELSSHPLVLIYSSLIILAVLWCNKWELYVDLNLCKNVWGVKNKLKSETTGYNILILLVVRSRMSPRIKLFIVLWSIDRNPLWVIRVYEVWFRWKTLLKWIFF